MRRIAFTAAAITLCISVLLVNSSDNGWSAWLYQPETGRLLQVNDAGRVISTQQLSGSIPLEAIAVAPDGTRLAFNTGRQIRLFDLRTGEMLALFDLPQPRFGPRNADDVLLLTPRAFSLDAMQLAFSYRIAGEGWALVLLGIASGEQVLLRAQDALSQERVPLHAGVLPQVQAVQADQVAFLIDEGNRITRHNYIWRPEANQLVESRAFPVLANAHLLNTDETLSPLPDSRLPQESAFVRLAWAQRNALHVHTAQQRFPMYAVADMDFERAWFIQGGERILLQAIVDERDNRAWLTLSRAGDRLRRQPMGGFDVQGTRDGFAYMTMLRGQSVLVQVNTRTLANLGQTVWVEDGAWRLLWADLGGRASYEINWAQLAAAHIAPQPPPDALPTRAATPLPLLRPGITAQIQLLEDDFLNLRDAPSLDSNVLAFLEDGVRMTLLEGPIAAEGFVWWRVRIGRREGYVVEALPDVQTIIPPRPTFAPTDQP